MDSFRVLGPKQVAYLDYTGSGVETLAHIKENNRIVIMMCAFKGPPKIFRFHGHARAHESGSLEFKTIVSSVNELTGARSIVVVN